MLPLDKDTRRAYFTRLFIVSVDAFLSFISFAAAVILIFSTSAVESEINFNKVIYTAFFVTFIRCFVFWLIKPYSFIIRFLGERDLIKAFIAIAVGSLAFLVISYSPLSKNYGFLFSRSLLVVDFVLLVFLMLSFRVAMRVVHNYLRRTYAVSQTNVVVFGAGELGANTIRVLQQGVTNNYNVIAIFDDNPRVNRKFLDGVKVFLPLYFEKIVLKYSVKRAIIAIKNLSPERKKEIIELCLANNVVVMEVAPTTEWLDGKLSVSQIKNVKVEDLLNRPPIQLDKSNIEAQLKGKVVLVTGAAGSIGSEMARQITAFDPKLLICLDQAETPLVDLELEIKEKIKFAKAIPIIADVSDADILRGVFEKYRPDIVFHAAAYKHVPIMEAYPREAINVNVRGSKNLADLSIAFGVKKFVMISTDKAVNPTNVMGASKRIAEIYCQSLFNHAKSTQFITTRFGNVLGSNGSVIPRFTKQIEAGGPVTVTHPDITRYFMTIPEACQLVLEAGAMGQGGEIFVFDMGEPVKIVHLAERMIQLAGFKPNVDMPIVFTGLRPGEKIYEELLNEKEKVLPTHHEKIMRAKVREYSYDDVQAQINNLLDILRGGNDMNIVKEMKAIVPEFISDNSIFQSLDKEKNTQ